MTEEKLPQVVRYSPELSPHFESLNREWIEQYFEIEDQDLHIFSDPLKNVVEPGGQIFFVIDEGKVVGTCALILIGETEFELGKMAVTKSAQGRGYGDLLLTSAIEFARQAGAKKIMLLSNTQLQPAIKLYEKHGFKSVPIKPEHAYARTDIEMELELRPSRNHTNHSQPNKRECK